MKSFQKKVNRMRTTNRTWSAILEELLEIAKSNGFEHTIANSGALVMDYNYYALIFRHDFAKALWGEEEQYTQMMATYKQREEAGQKVDYTLIPPPAWKRNLEALVLAEDKFLFLERHLDHLKKGELSEDEKEQKMKELRERLGQNFKR